MQTSHYSAPAIHRSRPSYGPLIFGSFFLWGGVAGILHDTTTMGLGPSLTIALSATGFAVAVLTLLPRFSDTEPAVSEPLSPTVQPRTEQPRTEQPRTEQQPTAAEPQPRSGSVQLSAEQTAEQTTVADDSGEPDESAATVQKHTKIEANDSDEQDDPWDADQGWASDIRW